MYCSRACSVREAGATPLGGVALPPPVLQRNPKLCTRGLPPILMRLLRPSISCLPRWVKLQVEKGKKARGKADSDADSTRSLCRRCRCCYGTAVESLSKLADSIYFHR